MPKHSVKCLYCGKNFYKEDEPYVKPRSNRYAHAKCAEEKGLSLTITDPTIYETCHYCKKQIDKSKEQYKELSKGKFAHLSCWDANKDKLTDKEKLENYICDLYGIKKITQKISRQIKDYVENYGYTYSGILKALVYHHEVKGNKYDPTKARGSIRIVEYVYQQAYNYYYSIWEAQQKQQQVIVDNSLLEKYIPKEITIKIPMPKPQPLKKRLFSFLDKDEVEEEKINEF